jgi:tetratricopeptide (TPR) repeat protein
MSNFNNRLFLLLTLLVLDGCQSTPAPAPGPEVEVVQAVLPAAVPETEVTTELEPEPEPEPEPIDFNQQFYDEAMVSLKAGNTDNAIELLTQVSLVAPEKPFVFTNLGLAYFKLEKYDFADQAMQQAILQNPDDAVAYNHLGILQRERGEFENARQKYQRAIEIDADYARAHLNLGILFDIYLQDLGKALQQYELYQSLTQQEDSQVAGWIVDIQRRIKPTTSNSQG